LWVFQPDGALINIEVPDEPRDCRLAKRLLGSPQVDELSASPRVNDVAHRFEGHANEEAQAVVLRLEPGLNRQVVGNVVCGKAGRQREAHCGHDCRCRCTTVQADSHRLTLLEILWSSGPQFPGFEHRQVQEPANSRTQERENPLLAASLLKDVIICPIAPILSSAWEDL
jgi:hypothetical protein